MELIEVADIFRQFAPSYLKAFGDRMLPSHLRAVQAIVACRTPALGGHVYRCEDCGKDFHVYHACRNRACPACHKHHTQEWLKARAAELLPCPYYHICVTVPAELREACRSNQSDCYGLLMKAASDAVTALCRDKRYMGATPAVLAVLHTWTGTMSYHPHVHLLVSGGGIGDGGESWREARHRFLVPVRALSRLVRGKFRAMLKRRRPDLEAQVDAKVWKKDWVTWCKYWGQGETAVLDYLGRYVHRIAITNSRIIDMDDENVTFRYKDRKGAKWGVCRVKGHEFMRRFLQHVPPKGFHKVRYYALWHPTKRAARQDIRLTLEAGQPLAGNSTAEQAVADTMHPLSEEGSTEGILAQSARPICPHCNGTNTRPIGPLKPKVRMPRARASPQ